LMPSSRTTTNNSRKRRVIEGGNEAFHNGGRRGSDSHTRISCRIEWNPPYCTECQPLVHAILPETRQKQRNTSISTPDVRLTGQVRRFRGELAKAKPDDRQPDCLVSHPVYRYARSGGEMARRLIARPFAERWFPMFSLFSSPQDTAMLRCRTTHSPSRFHPSPRRSGRGVPRNPESNPRSLSAASLRGSCDPRMTA
jgi:hypothetical protein